MKYEEIKMYNEDEVMLVDTQTGTKKVPVLNRMNSMDMKFAMNNPASSHNRIYRGMNLLEKYSIDDICDMARAGTFDDLFIGDYFDIKIKTKFTDEAEDVRCLIAGFDLFLDESPDHEGVKQHHIVIVPKECFETLTIMDSDSNIPLRGFSATYLYTRVLPVYSDAISKVFGEKLIPNYVSIVTKMEPCTRSHAGDNLSGRSIANEMRKENIMLMNEMQLFGTTSTTSSVYDISHEYRQFPIFQLSNEYIYGNYKGNKAIEYWMSSTISGTRMGCMGVFGDSTTAVILSQECGVRPYFLIG